MSTPAPPPRHLPRSTAPTTTGLFAGRQSARIRAIVSADLLPEERASADALVMTAWLTAEQRARYSRSLRAGQDPEQFVQHLADERRVVLEEGADPVAEEAESAGRAEQEARQVPLRVVEGVLLAVALGGAVALVVLGLVGEGSGIAGRIPESAPTLLVLMVIAVVLAAVCGKIATRRRDRALLDWAVSRPGQLGRGLPLHRPLQGESAGPAVLAALGPALLVGAGVLAIVAGAAILLITLMMGDENGWGPMAPWLLGGGTAGLVVAVLAIYLRSRRQVQRVRRARAAEWIGPTPPPEEPPAV